MTDDKFTTGPWNSHIGEMTGADGETRRKCFIRRKLYMARILKVQTWAMNGREREQE